MLNCRDISERKAFEEQLTHQAFHDPVTGLANRALFAERVRHAIARARREEHAASPSCSSTSTTSRRSTTASATPPATRSSSRSRSGSATSIRASDTAARFGGDEFALLLEDIDGRAGGGRHGRPRARVARAAAARSATRSCRFACSIGISVVSQARGGRRGGADPQRRRRDVPRQARRQGRLPDVRARDARGRARPARASHRSPARASRRSSSSCYYQPMVRLCDGSITGVEALLRWRHPERGHDPAGPVHPARRGDRADHPDRPVGAARGLPPRAPDARRAPRGRRAHDEHQPVA